VNHSGVNFLASAAFPNQQHWDVRTGDVLHHGIEGLDRWGMPFQERVVPGGDRKIAQQWAHTPYDQAKQTPFQGTLRFLGACC